MRSTILVSAISLASLTIGLVHSFTLLIVPSRSTQSHRVVTRCIQMTENTIVFDPLNIISKVSTKQYRRYQEVELKHGRIAMLATVGVLVSEAWHPIAPLLTGPASTYMQQILADMEPIKLYRSLIQLASMGILELKNVVSGWEYSSTGGKVRITGYLKDEYTIGDLGFDPLRLSPAEGVSSDEFTRRRQIEVSVGRIAMVGIIGMLAQENVDGLSIAEHFVSY